MRKLWVIRSFNWRIASVSKPVCAVSVLRALEDSAAWSLDSKLFGTGAIFGTGFAPFRGGPLNYLAGLKKK